MQRSSLWVQMTENLNASVAARLDEVARILEEHGTVAHRLSVVSGIEDGRVFYQKTMLTKGLFKTFHIEYDEGQKGRFDPLTAQMVRSFRG